MNVAAEAAPKTSTSELLWIFARHPMSWIHVLAIAGLVTFGARPIDWVVCVALYFGRMLAVTGGFHRYFAHRTFKTGRVRQFLLAFWAQTSAQNGALWWAAHHRTHHKESDGVHDVHSAVQSGFFWAHLGWILDDDGATDYDKIRDFSRYPELVWLNRYWWIPPILLGVAVYALLGVQGLCVGFFLSTVLLWHGTFLVNSLAHVIGWQDYPSGDESRNSWTIALLTLGEGWHNNHHYYQACNRQGFRWWQVDMTYYVTKLAELVGLVWDVREPPADVISGAKVPSHVRRKLARQDLAV